MIVNETMVTKTNITSFKSAHSYYHEIREDLLKMGKYGSVVPDVLFVNDYILNRLKHELNLSNSDTKVVITTGMWKCEGLHTVIVTSE